MAKTKAQKQAQVAEYRQKLTGSKSVIVLKTTGVSANEAVSLKKQIVQLGGSYNVVKNSLFAIALKEEKLPELTVLNSDSHAVVFTGEQISEAAKVLAEFAKKDENEGKMSLEGGILEGEAIRGDQVQELADLPSKDVLIAQLLSTLNGPMRGLVTVINGPMRGLAVALNGIKEQKA